MAQLHTPIPSNGPLCAALAVELRHVRASIERLAEVLVADEHFITHYLEQFQEFDLLAQYTDESASLLDRLAGGHDPDAAVGGVRLGVVQQRLRHALMQAA
jgi:hypothetical protein